MDFRKFEEYGRWVCERLVLLGRNYCRVTNWRIDKSKLLAHFVVHYILGRRFWGFRTSPSLELLRAANESRRSSSRSNEPKKKRQEGQHVIADFICPTPEARTLFPADYIVWVATIQKGRFDYTNAMFTKPEKFDCHVTTQNAKKWAEQIAEKLK